MGEGGVDDGDDCEWGGGAVGTRGEEWGERLGVARGWWMIQIILSIRFEWVREKVI
jgi:hypothetical protein